MRLIDSNLRKLVEFDDIIPNYAILSHRWTAGEVLHKDMVAGTAHLKPAYSKLVSCCQRAVLDGHKFVWIDTCCIDKTSSAELTEAINSMYNWYQQADVCYVYLHDVDIRDAYGSDLLYQPLHGGDSSQSITSIRENTGSGDLDSQKARILRSFGKSEWFRRGWTLQEMIAPQSLQFFDKNWVHVGIRDDIADVLSLITKVPVEILTRKRKPSQYCLADRMSWAATRKTTRIEDRAYSLLGLFNVSLPALYGEGRRAFRRLLEEILKTTDDMTFLLCSNRDNTMSALGTWVDSYLVSYEFDRHISMQYHHSRSGFFLTYPLMSIESDEFTEQDPEPFVLTNSGVIISLTLLPWSANRFLAPVARRATSSGVEIKDFLCIVLKYSDSGSTRTMQRTSDEHGSSIINLRVDLPEFGNQSNWSFAQQNFARFRSHASRKRVLVLNESHYEYLSRNNEKYLGNVFKFYNRDFDESQMWTPSPQDTFARGPLRNGSFQTPSQTGTYELFWVIRTRRVGRWWYLCCGLDADTSPFCLLSTKLPNQGKLSSLLPDEVSEEDLGWILHPKACLDLAKSDDFEGFLLTWGRPHHNFASKKWSFPTSDGKPNYAGMKYFYDRVDIEISQREESPQVHGEVGGFRLLYEINLCSEAEPDPIDPPVSRIRYWTRRFKQHPFIKAQTEALSTNVNGWMLAFIYLFFAILLNNQETQLAKLGKKVKELEDHPPVARSI